MACSVMRNPVLRNPLVRHYSLVACNPSQCPPQSTNPEYKVLNNKVSIVALNNASPVTQVSIIYKAGPRDESYEIQGISHMLRICAGLSTSCHSTFAITRNIQQLGGELTVTNDRETTSYTLRIIRDKLCKALPFFGEVATVPLFKPWEVSDEMGRLKYEAYAVPEYAQLIELAYKAAFRKGLGNSLYCPKRNIGKIDHETLRYFVANYYTAPKCAVVGSGISLDEVKSFAETLQLPSEDCSRTVSKYGGGEIRKDRTSELASVAVVVEGASLANRKEAIAFAVLQKAAGDGPKVKWGGCNGSLNKALACATSDPYAAVAFNASHSDSGLFGFLLSANPESVGDLVKAGTQWLKSSNISDQDVERAKASLKTSILSVTENQVLFHENMGHQVFTNCMLSPNDIAAEIDEITLCDVQNASRKVSRGKMSIAAIGNLSHVPYLNEL